MSETVLVGVLSDTHLGSVKDSTKLAELLLRGPFAGVEAILHAGDIVMPEFLSCFDDLPVYAVRGNMDPADPDLPLGRIVALAGYRIGLMHGWGAPQEVPFNVFSEFEHRDVDAVVFGHSHAPYLQEYGGLLLFNPGSATDHRGQAPACSVGLMTLGKTLAARHVFL